MFNTRDWLRTASAASLVTFATCFATLALPGCERKEKVLDVETPGGEVEVERNIDTGRVDVEVNEN